MRHEGLTAKQIQYIKPDVRARREVPCGPPAGLYCVVQPSGKKTFALRYRWHGGTRKLTFAKAYPDLTLAGARAEAEAALESLRLGVDPAAAKAEVEALAVNSVSEVADEWLLREVTGTRTFFEVKRVVRKEIVEPWKHRLISQIGRADVLRLLDSIVDRPAPVQANRVRSILLRLFGWALERGYVQASPVANIKPPAREKSREHALADRELGLVWTGATSLPSPFGPYIHLLILTAQRRGEVAGMRWQDVNLEKALWTLPPEQTKPGRIHDVPLSKAALEVLRRLPRFDGPHVFSTTGGARPISGFSKMRRALDVTMAAQRSGGEKNLADWRLHDLRRTAATRMAKSGVPPHVLAAILNHTPGSTQGVTSIYNRFRYTEERRAALADWAEYVLALPTAERLGRRSKTA